MSDLLVKFMKKENEKDVFHSSAYAKAQSGAAMGVTSSQSFADRRRMEQNRRIVQGYGDSRVANSAFSNGPKAKTFSQGDKTINHSGPAGMRSTVGGPGGVKPAASSNSITGGPRPVSMPKPIGLFGKK
ncbi:hypothetical protein IKF28_02355 [Candidatus Saccharibacteria bacterium]|nr:hypothetical protein [Candidatus Saccharibacteria bacterium]